MNEVDINKDLVEYITSNIESFFGESVESSVNVAICYALKQV